MASTVSDSSRTVWPTTQWKLNEWLTEHSTESESLTQSPNFPDSDAIKHPQHEPDPRRIHATTTGHFRKAVTMNTVSLDEIMCWQHDHTEEQMTKKGRLLNKWMRVILSLRAGCKLIKCSRQMKQFKSLLFYYEWCLATYSVPTAIFSWAKSPTLLQNKDQKIIGVRYLFLCVILQQWLVVWHCTVKCIPGLS